MNVQRTRFNCFSCNEDGIENAAVVWQDEGDRMGILGACRVHKALTEKYADADGVDAPTWIDHPSHGPDCPTIADGGICDHHGAWIHATHPDGQGAGEVAVCGARSDRGALRVAASIVEVGARFAETVTCETCLFRIA